MNTFLDSPVMIVPFYEVQPSFCSFYNKKQARKISFARLGVIATAALSYISARTTTRIYNLDDLDITMFYTTQGVD